MGLTHHPEMPLAQPHQCGFAVAVSWVPVSLNLSSLSQPSLSSVIVTGPGVKRAEFAQPLNAQCSPLPLSWVLKDRAEKKDLFHEAAPSICRGRAGHGVLYLWTLQTQAGEPLAPRNSKLPWTTQNVDLGRCSAAPTL